ncbi:hypothetical protein BRC81_03015 [Halobacteriales archaeon QS_1_68_20]|nr:MAG: hypothetical protein BRC81_03015 [Halobacteriales archaeon QS_1_68_20]
MSATTEADVDVDLSRYTDGPDRYVNFAREVLGIQLAAQQECILRALATNQRTVIMSGNGPGKSFGVAIAKLAFLVTNPGATVLGTSGSYSQYVDAVWRPMKQLHARLNERLPVDLGTPNDGGQPTLELDTDWFAKVVSPRDPGDLEGRHAEAVLVVIEEADKAYIGDEHFDSAGSSITDANDRMLAICNPPRDEANAVYERLESDRWHRIQFSTLESHNVRVDAGELDAEKIPGITDLSTVREDWEAWNGEPWPGIEQARRWSDPDDEAFREDLDERWYRRRAGVMPPTAAAAHRPIERADVKAAWEREPETVTDVPQASAVDVARSGADDTVAASVMGQALPIRYEESGDSHTAQRDDLTARFEGDPDHPIAVDALGEGSGLADMLEERFPETIRFGAGNEPSNTAAYYSCWEEGLDLLGDWLANGGSIDDRKLYEELLVAARTVEFEERHYASRGTEVLKATASKADLKDRLGRSPDRLDAAYMAVWARDSDVTAGIPTATATLGEGDESDERRAFKQSAIGQALQEYQHRQRGGRFDR